MEQKDNILFKDIYRNAYYIITGTLSINELLDYNGCVLPFEPFTENEEIEEEVYDDIIDYFIEREDYRKCAVIKKIKDSIYDNK